jgi:hypothetical protein
MLYLLCNLHQDKFDVLCSLGDSDSNIADISNNWTYAIRICDVEWIDLKILRDVIWNELTTKRCRKIMLSCSNDTISIHGIIAVHFKVFSIMTNEVLKVIEPVIRSYNIMVRYEDDLVVETYCDILNSSVLKKLEPLVTSSCCIII